MCAFACVSGGPLALAGLNPTQTHSEPADEQLLLSARLHKLLTGKSAEINLILSDSQRN